MKTFFNILQTKRKRLSARMILCALFLVSSSIQAQELTTTVSSNTISVGEQVEVTFSVNSTGKNFRAPVFNDFNVLVGPNQSTQMQIINGTVSQTISFTYVLQAIKEGSFKIGSAEITVGNKKLVSEPVTILVSKAAPKQQGGQGGNQGQSGDNPSVKGGGNNVFIRAKIDKSNVFIGEAISVTYRLYTKVTLLNYSVSKLPSFNAFWSQEISMPQQLEFRNENLDGVNYKVADIKKVVLFPQRTGSLSIDPMEGEVIARVQVKRQQNQKSNDPFDQFFNDPFFNNPFFNNNLQDIKVPLKSEPIKITVRDLPPGAPAGFTGAVGKFVCDISLDKKEVKAHDAVNLKIKITGKGNIRLIDAPHIEIPPDFETYDPKENVSAIASANGVSGSKVFEFLMIPRNAGEYKIPVAPFSYFDLDKKQYQTIESPSITLKVQRGNETETTVVSGVSKSDVQILGKDIRYIKTKETELTRGNQSPFNSPAFYTFMAAPALLFIGLLFIRKRNKSMAGNIRLIRSQRANKVAMKRLSAAKKFMAQNEKEKFLDEMFRALWGFISDKLQIPVSDLSKETTASALEKRNVPQPLIDQFTDTLNTCEFARFAGGTSESNEVIYNKGIEIISRLENAIS